MELRWTRAALEDLDAAGEFIRAHRPRAAARVAARVEEGVLQLKDYPALGRIGRVRGTREMVVTGTPFLVVYRVDQDRVQILRVLHHVRRWP